MNKDIFYDNFDFLMEKHKTTIKNIASVTGIKNSIIRDYRFRSVIPPVEDIILIADYYGVSASSIITKDLSVEKIKVVPRYLYDKSLIVTIFYPYSFPQKRIFMYNPKDKWYFISDINENHPEEPAVIKCFVDESRITGWEYAGLGV